MTTSTDPIWAFIQDLPFQSGLTTHSLGKLLKENGLVLLLAETDRGDGRKNHYGQGRQPLDDIVDAGWGPAFCAGNILKYLRRNKQLDDSQQKARWYWNYLNSLPDIKEKSILKSLLTERELTFLNTGSMPKE